jgi:dihydropteroate synthase
VFGVGNKPIIVTAWINRLDDNHMSLNPNLYISSKKERQERVKSIIDMLNNNKDKTER